MRNLRIQLNSQPVVTCMVNLSCRMSEKQAGTKLPSVSNDQGLTSNSCQQLGCASLLPSIMHTVSYVYCHQSKFVFSLMLHVYLLIREKTFLVLIGFLIPKLFWPTARKKVSKTLQILHLQSWISKIY